MNPTDPLKIAFANAVLDACDNCIRRGLVQQSRTPPISILEMTVVKLYQNYWEQEAAVRAQMK